MEKVTDEKKKQYFFFLLYNKIPSKAKRHYAKFHPELMFRFKL